MTARSDELSGETLTCHYVGAVAVLTLNRPEQLNVMNVPMREELWTFFDAIRADPRTRAMVVTGAGEAFCAGGDVNDFVEPSAEQMHDLMRDKSHRWFKAYWDLPFPVVAAVNGVAAGGGISLLLGADFVLASENARMGQTFVRVGLMPDLGGLFMLPRSIGLHRAKAMALTGDLIDARQAHELGLVYEVTSPDELLDRALALAQRLAGGPQQALAATKAVINRSFELSMEDVLHEELMAQSFLFGTEDHHERLAAFLDRGSNRKAAQE